MAYKYLHVSNKFHYYIILQLFRVKSIQNYYQKSISLLYVKCNVLKYQY